MAREEEYEYVIDEQDTTHSGTPEDSGDSSKESGVGELLNEYVSKAREKIEQIEDFWEDRHPSSPSSGHRTTYEVLADTDAEWDGKKEEIQKEGQNYGNGTYGETVRNGERWVDWTYGEPGNTYWEGEDWIQVSEGDISKSGQLRKIHYTSGDAEETARVTRMLQHTFRELGIDYAIKVDADEPYEFEGDRKTPDGESRHQKWRMNTAVAYVKGEDFDQVIENASEKLKKMGLESAAYKDAFNKEYQSQEFGGTYERKGGFVVK